MTEEQQASDLDEARGLRNEAWRLVRGDIARVREGLDGRTIANRLKDRAAEEVADAIDQAREVATEHKAIVAGTILALFAWLLRAPIAMLFDHLLGADGADGDEKGAEGSERRAAQSEQLENDDE